MLGPLILSFIYVFIQESVHLAACKTGLVESANPGISRIIKLYHYRSVSAGFKSISARQSMLPSGQEHFLLGAAHKVLLLHADREYDRSLFFIYLLLLKANWSLQKPPAFSSKPMIIIIIIRKCFSR